MTVRAPSRLGGRAVSVITMALLAVGASACERGCLSSWLAQRAGWSRVGGDGQRGSRERSEGELDLGGTDCSDGLARCVGGQVETSVAGHVPHPCTPRDKSGTCQCAWRTAAHCEAGCVEDGLEIVARVEVAGAQLCAATEPVLRPLLPDELAPASFCAGEGVSCVDGTVRLCAGAGQPARGLGACVGGCASGVTVEAGDLLAHPRAAIVLCRHGHTERR